MENNKGNTNSSHYLKRKEEDIPIASYDVLHKMSIKELEKYIDNLMKHENRTKTLDGKNLKLARKRATKVFLKKKLDYAIAARKSMDAIEAAMPMHTVLMGDCRSLSVSYAASPLSTSPPGLLM